MINLRNEIKFLLYGVGIIISIVLGIFTPHVALTLPFLSLMGLTFVVIMFVADLSMLSWRAKSSHAITNVGHFSLCAKKDVHHIPWHDEYITVKDEQNKVLGEMTVLFTGGIDFGVNIHGSSEHPVIIFPSIYEESEGDSYHINANLTKYDLNELSPYLRFILSRFKGRVKDSTPIYYGTTSHLDGTATPERLKVELKNKGENQELNELQERLDRAYLELNRKKREKEKPFYLKTQGEVEED